LEKTEGTNSPLAARVVKRPRGEREKFKKRGRRGEKGGVATRRKRGGRKHPGISYGEDKKRER